MIVEKTVSFDAAHQLKGYDGPCGRVHGHRFSVSVGVKGDVKSSGMIFDFAKLKKWMNKNIVDVFDHTLINDTIENPTAENIALWIVDKFQRDFVNDITIELAVVKVWETPDSMVEWRP